jgi:hypothetical protein
MPRKILCFTALAAFCLPVRADQKVTETETIIRLRVQPMAAPQPALRYLLLPELKEMNPGNPIQGYLRCFAEQQNFFFSKEACERREQLETMPLKELPAQELQDYGKLALRQADCAARLDTPDWQALLKLKTESIGLPLADVQQVRTLIYALKVRFRAEVALHRFDDALRTAKTMFALSRHMAEHPTLIADLIGIATAMVTIGPLEEMLEQPGGPNLYWALTNLPKPLIPLERGMEGERLVIATQLHDLGNTEPMSADQLKALITHIDKLGQVEGKTSGVHAWLDARTKDENAVNAARRRLLEVGLPAERRMERIRQLLRLPAEQVILLNEMRAYEVRRDEIMKLMNLPTWQRDAMVAQLNPEMGERLFGIPVTPVSKVLMAQGRLEQRIALLQHVEAVRLYAAEHDGQLPENVSDCPVPLPPDPFTGKPFDYRLEGTTAHLRGSPPRGMEKSPGSNFHYEVTIQK